MYTSRMLADYIEELCDTFNDAMCVTDRNGICVLVNRRHSELTGIPKRDIVGHRVQDMVLQVSSTRSSTPRLWKQARM